MPISAYAGVTGTIERISPIRNQCCSQLVSLRTSNGIQNFVVSSQTYVADQARLRARMRITAFYDANLPVPLIYPPQFQAAFIAETAPRENVMVAFFNNSLLSVDQSLQLNVDSSTRITTANGQNYTCRLGNNLLMVYYTATTRSLPPQTTPEKIIVFC